MEEAVMLDVKFTFKDGTVLDLEMTDCDVDLIFDKLWERDPIMWINNWDNIVNLDDVRHIEYRAIDE